MIPILPRIQKTDRWHARRRKGLGGSEWVSILSDQHPEAYPYGCIRRLYYKKKSAPPDFDEKTTKPAIRGNIFENVVAELFKADTGCKFTNARPKADMLWPGQKVPDWWLGTPDRIAVMLPEKTLEVLECKTMGREVWFEFLENGLSVGYTLQPQHYMGKTGLETAHVAVIWPDGIDYQDQVISRDEETLRLMFEAGTWFMRDVVTASEMPKRPPLTEKRCGSCPYALTCLGKSYWEIHDIEVTNLSRDEQLYDLLVQRELAKGSRNDSEKQIKALDAEIQELITGEYGDDVEHFFCREIEVKWAKGMHSRFERQDLLADHPELSTLIKEYTKFFPSRTFSPTITKKSTMRWEGRQK